jgi:hypothetical protein
MGAPFSFSKHCTITPIVFYFTPHMSKSAFGALFVTRDTSQKKDREFVWQNVAKCPFGTVFAL